MEITMNNEYRRKIKMTRYVDNQSKKNIYIFFFFHFYYGIAIEQLILKKRIVFNFEWKMCYLPSSRVTPFIYYISIS